MIGDMGNRGIATAPFRATMSETRLTLTRRQILIAGTLAAAGGLLNATGAWAASGIEGETSNTQAENTVALGAWIPNAAWDISQLDQFAAMVEMMPTILLWYLSWNDHELFDPFLADALVARGIMPVLTWEPQDYTKGTDQTAFRPARIAAGEFDEYIRRWGHDLAAWGKPLYLRLAHEMNGNWYPWSPGVNGNTTGDYIAMWRHVVTLFRKEGATNVRWVWSPTGPFPDSTSLADVYPGDGYVDWLGSNAFNFGTSQRWSKWMGFAEIYAPLYDEITQLTDKPLMIAEMACVEAGGDKAKWISHALSASIPARFPRVRAIVWFNENKYADADWRVNSSVGSLATYREVASARLYRGQLI